MSNKQAEYALSDNQQQFVKDATHQGLDVDYTYSGRFMCGTQCPSVRVGGAGDFRTEARYRQDSMGMGYVLYAAN